MPVSDASTFARWKADPVAFVTEVLRDPDRRPLLREALAPLTPDGRLPVPDPAALAEAHRAARA